MYTRVRLNQSKNAEHINATGCECLHCFDALETENMLNDNCSPSSFCMFFFACLLCRCECVCHKRVCVCVSLSSNPHWIDKFIPPFRSFRCDKRYQNTMVQSETCKIFQFLSVMTGVFLFYFLLFWHTNSACDANRYIHAGIFNLNVILFLSSPFFPRRRRKSELHRLPFIVASPACRRI